MSDKSKPSGLLARLFGAQTGDDKKSELPMAIPVESPIQEVLPMAIPVGFTRIAGLANPDTPTIDLSVPAAKIVESILPPCPACTAPRRLGMLFCEDCGYMFPETPPPANSPEDVELGGEVEEASSSTMVVHGASKMAHPLSPLQQRYEIVEELSQKRGVQRYRGVDTVTGHPVVILVQVRLTPSTPAVDEEFLPEFDAAPEMSGDSPEWPSIGWEFHVLGQAIHPAIPTVIERGVAKDHDFLVEQSPQGRVLWDAWDDPAANASIRYGYFVQIAEALKVLHRAGAMVEGIHPDKFVVTDAGQVMFADLGDLLPLPPPSNAPIRATLYTAPELVLSPQTADARADLYSVGAMLYSLEFLHHPLEDRDFEHQFVPNQITERFPDVHPLFLRLINKTFVRDLRMRFPTDEACKTDETGFDELLETLQACRRSFDAVRMDIASWTTTGMIRTGNEDAFAVLHRVDCRLDGIRESSLILLCDGMGGYEAGEVAAALTIDELKKFLLAKAPFSALAGAEPDATPLDAEACQMVLRDALRHANREVFNASRTPSRGRRGMGCTAEAVYLDGNQVIVAHVGDSRTYHLHRGRLWQVTRDQTFVQRMVELGQLSPKEAEDHPRKNELQQAIGGQPEVTPAVHFGRLERGDWVVVCSDGVSNHLDNGELEKMLTREANASAEAAARRLINLVNLRGATDNATIVVVRAT